jgi:Tol biopolymer transport system component
VISTLTPTLEWSEVTGADYYAVAIRRYPYGSGNIIYNSTRVSGTSITVPSGPLVAGEKYQWSLQAHGPWGWTNASNALYFQTQMPTYTLTVSVRGEGALSLSPPGGSYEAGTQVTLTATPAPGWWLSGWSGDLTGSQNPANETMSSNKSVAAIFLGGCIAFTSDRDGNNEIYLMNPDGSGQTRLTNNGAQDYFPTWSPDATRIGFVSDRDGNNEIYVINADGSGLTRLTNSPASDFYPAWSPDGTTIAFVSDRDGNREIHVMKADGSVQTRLTKNPASDLYPTWSPDGTTIAFTSDRNANRQIYIMNADGSRQIRLTNNSTDDELPAWSCIVIPQ